MPNWVKNRIIIMDNNYEDIIKKLIDKEGELDFNKLIPMPKSLMISSGTITDTCVKLYLNSLLENSEPYNKYLKIFENYKFSNEWKMSQEDIENEINHLILNKSQFSNDDNFKTKADVYARGKQVLDNITKYGHKDWYDWSISKWGTKWNASETNIVGNEIYFDTAWDPVPPIIEALSQKFPNTYFHYDYAEEQMCVCCGEFEIINGQMQNFSHYPMGSKEAYEKAFELWGGSDFYKYNKKTKTYEYIDDEENEDDEGME